jgi:hypothetical protein
MSQKNDVTPLPILRRCAPDEARQIRALVLVLDLGAEVPADQADRAPEAPLQAAATLAHEVAAAVNTLRQRLGEGQA